MTTTFAAAGATTPGQAFFAAWGSTGSTAATTANAAPGSASCVAGNPTHASTEMVGGQVRFENDNYRITAGDDNTVTIFNKHTGETYQAWGDPHMNVDGQHAFDFWGTTSFQLEDGTKVTIETTPWEKNDAMTLSSKVTITNGDYGVQISGVDTNTRGDLKFDEAGRFGSVLDAVVADGNVLHENPAGAGFVAIEGGTRVRAVDQAYIDATDLKKGGALQARADEAFRQMGSLLTMSFVAGFVAGWAFGRALDGGGERARAPAVRAMPAFDTGDLLLAVASRGNPALSFFLAAAAR